MEILRYSNVGPEWCRLVTTVLSFIFTCRVKGEFSYELNPCFRNSGKEGFPLKVYRYHIFIDLYREFKSLISRWTYIKS